MLSTGSALGATLLGFAGGGVGAFAVFKTMGTKWLEARFAKRLQDLKHQHGQELERLKGRINELLDRSSKLNQREFEVLPEAWSLVFEAYVSTERLVTRLRRTHDFSRMPDAHMENVLADSPLADWQRDELRSKKPFDRTTYFIKALYWYELRDAKVAAQKADFYLQKYGIFLSDPVNAELTAFVEYIWKAISDHELRKEMLDDGEVVPEKHGPAEDFRKNADARVKDLGKKLRSCFRPDEGTSLVQS